jgi:replicative DNA helicase
MTIGIEKIFFGYILQNKKYFHIIDSYFFKNNEIQFVYDVLRKYMLKDSDVQLPSPKQILEMINLEDKDGLITKDILKSILSVDLNEYDEDNFIIPRFNAWILSNRLKAGTVDIVEETRNLDAINDFETTLSTANKIKEIVEQMSSLNFINDDDDDMGSDFDDVEAHVQDSAKFKIKSGFATLDHMLGGGWDIGTLNMLMGETNSGKSLWMQNLAVASANMGSNVLYVTLEMSERKVLKRLGAMRLKIPINDYDEVSKDTAFMQKKIDNLKKSSGGGSDLFEKKIDKIYTRFWAAGTANVNDIDNYLQKLKDRKGVKIDLVIVDYLTLMVPPGKANGSDTLYIKGKVLAEGLRALGSKYKCPVISALQVAKDAWNSSNISLESVPESKAIPETADTFFAIIRNEEMKRQNLYRLKMLKQRDGDFSKSQIRINLNPTYLNLEGDQFIDA